MNKTSKILIVSLIATIFSATSAFAFNTKTSKDDKKSVIDNLSKEKNSSNSKNFNPCSACAGCNGNCIIKKL